MHADHFRIGLFIVSLALEGLQMFLSMGMEGPNRFTKVGDPVLGEVVDLENFPSMGPDDVELGNAPPLGLFLSINSPFFPTSLSGEG